MCVAMPFLGQAREFKALKGQEKAKYLKFIGLLEKRSETIRDTLQDCRQVFETKESQQSLVGMKG